jgi:predicted kinase
VVEKANARSVLIHLDVPAEVLKERKKRNKELKTRHDVPSSWLEEDAADFERPTEAEDPIVYKPADTIDNLVKAIEGRTHR